MSSVGKDIWYGFVPVLNILATGIVGYVLAHKNMFTIAASKGVSQLVMNVTLPALIFSNFVPAFTSDNVNAMAPLFLLAFLYEIMGGVLALVVRESMPVPRLFHHGILIAGSVANWGNLPTAIVSAIMVNPPFDSSTDPQKGIAYISIFILVSNVTFFPLGASQYALRDFKPKANGPEQGNSSLDLFAYESIRNRWSRRSQHIKQFVHHLQGIKSAQESPTLPFATPELQINPISKEEQSSNTLKPDASAEIVPRALPTGRSTGRLTNVEQSTPTKRRVSSSTLPLPDPALVDSISLAPIDRHPLQEEDNQDDPSKIDPSNHALWGQIDKTPIETRATSPVLSENNAAHHEVTIPLGAAPLPSSSDDIRSQDQERQDSIGIGAGPNPSKLRRLLKKALRVIIQFRTPATMTMIPSIIIALVNPLKALFVETSSDYGIPRAPDGKPPLACIMNVASFIGNVTVPLSLILLGASVGRMKIPKPISRLPLSAILALAVARLVVMPICGILIVQALTFHTSLIDPSNKALRFVCMLVAGSPTSVNQLVVSQIHAPDGNVDTLSAFIGVQYLGLVITTTALSAIALTLI